MMNILRVAALVVVGVCAVHGNLWAQTHGAPGDPRVVDPPAPRAPALRLAAPDGAGFLGTADSFGRRVDADEALLVIADEAAAFVANLISGTIESPDLLTLVPAPLLVGVVGVNDVALDVPRAAVLCRRATQADILFSFVRVAGAWQFKASHSFEADVPGIPSVTGRIAWRDGILFSASTGVTTSYTSVFRSPTSGAALEELSTSGTLLFASRLITDLAAGANPVSGLPEASFVDRFGAVTSLWRWANTGDGLNPAFMISYEKLLTGGSEEIGAAVARAGNHVFLGDPGDDTQAADAGAVRVLNVVSTAQVQTLFAPNAAAGDRFGRALAAAGTRLVVSEAESELLPGSSGVGLARVARLSGPRWKLTGEVIHNVGATHPDNEDFGADLSLSPDGLVLAGGAPGDGALNGSVGVVFPPAVPWFEHDVSPDLAGFGGMAPELILSGGLYGDSPLLIQVADARPSSAGFMILGFATLDAPFKGGVMHPTLNFIVNLPTSGAGSVFLPTIWPPDGPAAGPFDLELQYWVQDPDGPVGFASTAGATVHQD